MFLSELCDLLEVPRPDPTSPDPEKNLFVFDRAITRIAPDGTSVTNYIDFYKATHFVLETKQGVGEADTPGAAKSGHGRRGSAAFDKALERAYHQGRDYITHLPTGHSRPPFLIVCDVGHSIDLYAEFTCTGGRYERFPDPRNHRILLSDLHRPEVRERLRLVFTDPHALDPSKKAAEVTRDIATRLAKLAKSLEADGHEPQAIAGFLQRCLFTMFAEDIGLLPDGGFQQLLERVKTAPQGFPVLISSLWKEMATGTDYSTLLFQKIAHFSGGLFEDTSALPLSAAQIAMLADASATDWSSVEPSIFGTLLTRALDPRERHKLGAEYTPRSYVERLIRPTIIDPLREEWESTRLAAANLHREAETALDAAEAKEAEAKPLLASGNTTAAKEAGAAAQKLRAEAKKHDADALQLVTDFHRRLCALRILDPACGTANFLYVTLEHLKRLEAEVLELATALGGDATFEMKEYRVRPEQFLGLEISPNAVAIAQLVLWIGYFQWQRKTTGKADTGDRPLLPKTPSIRQQDAVLAYDERIPRKNPDTGEILTIWDGHTTKPHPVTGKEIPDESARIPLFDYTNPRRAEWPQADHIVGNPPFLGASRMRDALGDGYTEALRAAWKGDVPESADLVMFWWSKAAAETAQGRCQRFGFITTNSIHQTFNRRVIEPFLADATHPLHLAYAIPDHPWENPAAIFAQLSKTFPATSPPLKQANTASSHFSTKAFSPTTCSSPLPPMTHSTSAFFLQTSTPHGRWAPVVGWVLAMTRATTKPNASTPSHSPRLKKAP
jgi:SAM-dependent methyltransferase